MAGRIKGSWSWEVAMSEAKIDSRFERGTIHVERTAPAPQAPIPLIPLAKNPLFGAWMEAIEKYREEKEQQDRAIFF
jgi:hypothetical protein